MKSRHISLKKIFLLLSDYKKKGFVLILLLLFFWYIYSLMPFPFVQCSDGYFTTIPRIVYVIGEILNGRIPLWNEYQFCGITFLLADGNTMFPNLITIFYFFMSPLWAYTLGTIVLFIILIIGTWAYFRERGFSKTASLIGTIGYAYGGQILFWSIYHGMNLSLTLFPMALFAFRRFERTGEIRWNIIAFISVFLLAIGGFIQFSIIAAVSCIIEGVDDFSFSCVKKVLKGRFITVLLAIFSASFIIMPTVEAGIFSHRKLCSYSIGIFPNKINAMSMIFWGTSFGKHSNYPNYFFYFGIVLIALSVFAIRKSYKKIFLSPYFIYSSMFPIILVFFCTGIMPMNFQFGVESDPWRGMFVFILLLSILAATGTDIYMKQLKSGNKLVFPPFELLIAGLASICICLYKFIIYDYNNIVDKANVTVLGFLILLGFVLSFILNKKESSIKIVVFSFWLILLVMVNALYPSYTYLKTNVIRNEIISMNPWEKEGLPIHILSGEGRFVELRADKHICLEEWGIYSKIRALGGGNSLLPGSIFSKMINDGLLPPRPGSVSHFKICSILNPDILAKYGVLYLIKHKEVSSDPTREGWQFCQEVENYLIYINPKYVGRAYIIDKKGNIIKGANIVKNTNSYVKISIDADGGDVLILADSWYPGWKCYENGKEVGGFNAAGFRGYDIEEKGYYEIEWIYKPTSFYIGLIISGISLLAFFFLTLLNKFVMR